MIPHVIATLALVAVALLLGATCYESVVMAANYQCDVPASITLARQFLSRTTPAHYFRRIAPVAQLLTLAAAVADWRQGGFWPFVGALVALVVVDIITFSYHYPRLAIMFKSADLPEEGVLRRAAREWADWNWVRAVLLLVAFLALLHGLLRIATRSVV
ncbi:MAG: anthrone oxygenase family protein [Gemmatimonadales bacterium]